MTHRDRSEYKTRTSVKAVCKSVTIPGMTGHVRRNTQEAITDGVCRSPRIVLLDNQKVKLTEEVGADCTVKMFPSINNLLCGSSVTYEEVLRHEEVIEQLLDLSCRKLDELRRIKPDAAGLVVATDIEHAQQIAKALGAKGEESHIVTTRTPGAQQVINFFRHSSCRWIVAVGMISEGTDIPRLQVCCYFSRIRTELHYRQVLGRVLRRIGQIDEQAWLFMLAEQTLQQMAERISDDLPDDLAVLTALPLLASLSDERPDVLGADLIKGPAVTIAHEVKGAVGPSLSSASNVIALSEMTPEQSYQISFSQDYRQQLLACF